MGKHIKILLVDDDRDLLQVLQMALEMNPLIKVITSINGQEACFKFRNEDFDVIVTDLKMPKMDGIEFIHSVMKIKDVPIFVISASLEAFKFKIREYRLKEMRNIHILPKPFEPDELVEKVKEVLKVLSPAPAPVKEVQLDSLLKFEAGQTVFEENSTPTDLYIVKEGTFIVFKKSTTGENVPVSKICAGEVMGEMSVFSGGRRTTTVKAETSGVLVRLPLEKVKETMNAQPVWFKVMMKTITLRLSETTTALAEARTELKEREVKFKKEA